MGLAVKDLTKTFGEKTAVDGICFNIDEPSVFGLIGTNGAGKTTTIRMLLGIMSSDFGSAEFDGKPISRDTLRFGYMPEERGIYMKTKVLEQLIYFGMLRSMSKTDAKQSALRLIDRLGVTEYKDMTAEKLSKGNQQKVQLIATLIHNPQLVVLDEPFSGLDPVNVDVLRSIIDELADEGKYIIMSSHQMSVVEDYCSSIVLLDHGKTILNGNLREIKSHYGHTNLSLICTDDVSKLAQECDLKLISKNVDRYEFKISGDDMAKRFITRLFEQGIYPLKYEIKEPSLHEIFIEKVGQEQ